MNFEPKTMAEPVLPTESRERRAASLADHADDVFTLLRLIDSVDPKLGGLERVKRRAKELEETMLAEVYSAPGDHRSLENARSRREVAADEQRAREDREVAHENDAHDLNILDAMIAEHPHPDETGRWGEEKRTVVGMGGKPYTYTVAVPIGDFAVEVARRRTEEPRLDELDAGGHIKRPVIHDPNAREWPNCHPSCLAHSRTYPELHDCVINSTGAEFAKKVTR